MALTTHSPEQIMQYHIVAVGLAALPVPGTTPTWPIWASGLADEIEQAISVVDTMAPTQFVQMNGENVTHPQVQVLVRSKAKDTTWAKIKAIADAMDAIKNTPVVIGAKTYRIQVCRRVGDPIPLGFSTTQKEQAADINREKRRSTYVVSAFLTVWEE